MRPITLAVLAVLVWSSTPATAQLSPAPQTWAQWPTAWAEGAPGAFDASALLDKPAGRGGIVQVQDGHFFSGGKRLRFWGVNICFGGCFPTHEQADAIAQRLSRHGINAVRFHHMDNQPFPNGIFADRKLEKLSEEALDRLDYFLAALAKQGIYADLNLHVSRDYARSHQWQNAEKLPSYDKMVDVFYPELIAAQKQYARDLLGHVNAYTKKRYADEPAVGVVEINNEDSLFMWGADQAIANLPEPYAGELQKQWNQWLAHKYVARAALAQAWSKGADPLGAELMKGGDFNDFTAWKTEQHTTAKMTVQMADKSAKLTIVNVSETTWHLQFKQSPLALGKRQYYTLAFTASADKPRPMSVSVGQGHDPWGNLGLGQTVKLEVKPQRYRFGFIATEADVNARLSFIVGQQVGIITLSDVSLRTGGQEGLRDNEDPEKATVAAMSSELSPAPSRLADWYQFLQATDENYFVEMRRFLKDDLGVKCPVAGTIGFGPLGTLGQSKMDFVDAHAYWDHPQFPNRPWDPGDWLIRNKPMVDDLPGATLWRLAVTRVAGKPFTVTEYNHAAPNEFQAECIPMIATFAALQDWDGVFLFAYSHNANYDKAKMDGFFDVEGNPLKMPLLPLGSRIFLGGAVLPNSAVMPIFATRSLLFEKPGVYGHDLWRWAQDQAAVKPKALLGRRMAMEVSGDEPPRQALPALTSDQPADGRLSWLAPGPGAGQFVFRDGHAAIFVGFPKQGQIELGPLTLSHLSGSFVTVMLVPAGAGQTLDKADRLLLAIVSRAQNTGQTWNDARTTLSRQWGKAPAQVEALSATLRLPKEHTVRPLDSAGTVRQALPARNIGGAAEVQLGDPVSIWYEILPAVQK